MAFNMSHQVQNGFLNIFVVIAQYQRGYLVYIPHRRKIIYLYGHGFDDIFSSVLAYISQLCAEAMAMLPAVSYILYSASSREQTGNLITFEIFEKVNLISETCNNMEIGNKHDDNSTLAK